MAKTDIAYRLLNAATHSRGSPSLHAPVLVRHCAIWCNRSLKTADRSAWRNDVDRALAQTVSALGHKIIFNDAVTGDNIVYFRNIASSKEPEVFFESGTIALTPQEEFLLDVDLRSIFLSADYEYGRLSIRFELHTEYISVSCFFSPVFDAGNKVAWPGFDENLRAISDLYFGKENDLDSERVSSFLFREFWTTQLAGLPFSDVEKSKELGFTFADFRGLILSDKIVPLPCEVASGQPLQWGTQALKAFRPLIGASEETDLTATYMLDGRAFYMTTLAPPSLQVDPTIRNPLAFLMYVHQHAPGDHSRQMVSPSQLGRLIDRLFLLGTMRLAALIDLEKLRKAGRVLAALEPEARKARQQLDQGNEYECEIVIKQFHRDISDLKIEGGLEYRVERSRYYVEEFNNALSGLRIARVEGFQPYDLYVKQKLGARFLFIDRLGFRYERALNSTYRLAQSQLSLSLTNVQRFGEVIIFCGLLPYYLNDLLEAVLGDVSWRTTCLVWAFLVAVGAYRLFQYKGSQIFPTNKLSNVLNRMFEKSFLKTKTFKQIVYIAVSAVAGFVFYVILQLLHAKLGKPA